MVKNLPRHDLRIAIVGGRAAGLSTAIFLQHISNRLNVPKITLTIFSSPTPTPSSSSRSKIGVGIWSTALTALNQCGASQVVNELKLKGKFMGSAGYRSPSGKWLATSSLSSKLPPITTTPLPPLPFLSRMQSILLPSNPRPSLLFTTESQLITSLTSHVNRGIAVGHDTTFINEQVTASTLPLLKKKYDMIIGCDGSNSVIRHNSSLMETEDETIKHRPALIEGTTDLAPCGYLAFRGNSSIRLEDDCSFQTLGHQDYMRFAAVPMGNGVGSVWFATVSTVKFGTLFKNSDATENKGNDDVKRKLNSLFEEWHDPVLKMINSTPENEIEWEVAKKLPLSISTAEIDRNQKMTLVGDSYHASDPVLAQGFTIAIEDSAELAHWIQLGFETYVEDDQRVTAELRRLLTQTCLRAYESGRARRIENLYTTSQIVTGLVRLNPVLGWMRDLVLSLTPDFFKKPIFNYVMDFSMTPPPRLPK